MAGRAGEEGGHGGPAKGGGDMAGRAITFPLGRAGGGGVGAGQTKPVSGQAWWLTGRKFGRINKKGVRIKNAVSWRNWRPKCDAFILLEWDDIFSEDSFLYRRF